MARAGRKLKLTDAVTEKICDAIGIGATVEIACAYAAVSTDCYYKWIREAKGAIKRLEENPDADLTDSERKYIKFYNKVERVKSYAAIGWLQVIDSAAVNDPNWAKFMLKVRYPGDFDEVHRSDVTSGGEKIKVVAIGGLDPSEDI